MYLGNASKSACLSILFFGGEPLISQVSSMYIATFQYAYFKILYKNMGRNGFEVDVICVRTAYILNCFVMLW